jgi:glutathione S-transferase
MLVSTSSPPTSNERNDPVPDEQLLRVQRIVNAPRERVFRAWTDPDELKAWWGPGDYTTPEASVDLRVGGAYALVMQPPDGAPPFRLAGTYLEIDPPARLVYTWRWDAEDVGPGETTVTVDFVELDGRTEIVVQHGPFADKAAGEPYKVGWSGGLENLARHLATRGRRRDRRSRRC